MDIYAIIMAGGVGSRFWPKSREKMPKQLLKIFGDNTMIQDTVKRISKFIKYENIIVVTNKIQRDGVLAQLPELPLENIISEPFGRNTAICVGLASLIISKRKSDAVSIVLPADHLIKDDESFINIMKNAADFAHKSKALMTIGIQPTRPETGYGYIQREELEVSKNIFKVKTFAEKPNHQTAVRFLESGDFLWNSGMFIWRVDTVLHELMQYLPDTYNGLQKIEKALNTSDFDKVLEKVYGMAMNISVDYGIMEKSKNVYVIKSTFDWSDVGSWEEVYLLSNKDIDGNFVDGDIFLDDVKNSYISSNKKFISVSGIDNLIIIDTDDALLICDRNKSQDVKKIVDFLKKRKSNDLL